MQNHKNHIKNYFKKFNLLTLLLLLTLSLLAFAGCTDSEPGDTQNTQNIGQNTSQNTEPIMTLDEYPVVDGSTANLPMMYEIMSRVTGITTEEAAIQTKCSKTSGAWYELAYGGSDLLLVYEASEGTKAELADIGTEMEITPIGRDALVFIVNEDNPIDSLTEQQLIDIYTGKITNWSELGGNDQEILPFQRPEASGSQSLFMKLLMTDDTPIDAPKEMRPSEMGGLIETLASYNNSANALGYSVFYYASYMYQQPGLKFVAVNGVLPSDETIADGTYPLLNEYYLAIRADEPADSNTRKLQAWILSDAGYQAIKDAGYIPLAHSAE